jgi:hypothetical protein
VLWLAPRGPSPFSALTRRVYQPFPGFPPFGGQFDEIIPHLTIGHGHPVSTGVTSSRAIASRETCSSVLARSSASSPIRLRSRSAPARAAASRRLSSSISDPIRGLLPQHTTVEDHIAD